MSKPPRVLGIVGGLAPESTILYYRQVIAGYREALGTKMYPRIIINSIDVTKMLDLAAANAIPELTDYLVGAVNDVARAGADFALIACNTAHLAFEYVERVSPIPLISIVDAALAETARRNFARVALFGSRVTMQSDFYARTFSKRGVELISPNRSEQEYINRKYMNELVSGTVLPETRDGLLDIVKEMRSSKNIDAVVLGGTELSLILSDGMSSEVPFLDTTRIHINAAVSHMITPLPRAQSLSS